MNEQIMGKPIKRAQSLATVVKTGLHIFDGKTIMAMAMALMAMVIASYSDTGLAASLASIGISPKGFSMFMVVCAGLILKFPNDRLYAFCVLPYLVVVLALVNFIIKTNSTPASIIPYVGFFLLALRQEDK